MDEEEQRALLEAVAAGEISPEEAARRLEADDALRPPDPAGTARDPRADADADDDEKLAALGKRRIRVEAAGAAIRVIGDPSVTTVLVEGEHEIDERGDVTVVRCEPLRTLVGAGARGGGFRIHGGRSFKHIDFGSMAGNMRTTVRMNPDLPLDIDVNAGWVNVRGVHSPITADIDAGAAHLRDVRSPIDVTVNAGAITVDGRLDSGDSHISCDMGATTVRLARDSDVRVRASMDLGKCEIKLPPAPDADNEYVLGQGRGQLSIRGAMGTATVSIDK